MGICVSTQSSKARQCAVPAPSSGCAKVHGTGKAARSLDSESVLRFTRVGVSAVRRIYSCDHTGATTA